MESLKEVVEKKNMQNIEAAQDTQPIARVEADLESLIPTFLNNRKKDLSDLATAIGAQDFQTLERIGHILKGVSASYGFEKMGHYGALLETAAKAKQLHDCQTQVEGIRIYLRDVKVVFE